MKDDWSGEKLGAPSILFRPWGIRAGFEPFGACDNIYGSKPARFNSVKKRVIWPHRVFRPTSHLSPFTF